MIWLFYNKLAIAAILHCKDKYVLCRMFNTFKIMRKHLILFVLILLVTSFSSQAQSSSHLMFKGVPIDGQLTEFVDKMKAAGFVLIRMENRTAMLKGDFAGYKDCVVEVSTLKDKDLVNNITVVFPGADNWPMLSSNYFSLKNMLTEKYGRPTENVEQFQTGLEPTSDANKIFAARYDQIKYIAIYEGGKGRIELSVVQRNRNPHVILSYSDKINSEIVRSKAMDDL